MTAHRPARPASSLLDFGSRALPDRVARQVHRVPSGGRLDCSGPPWGDALAWLEVGCVELRVASGASLHLCPGSIFSLHGLTPAVLTAVEPGSAVISTLHRRTEGEAP